jgi:hypothetical protein
VPVPERGPKADQSVQTPALPGEGKRDVLQAEVDLDKISQREGAPRAVSQREVVVEPKRIDE